MARGKEQPRSASSGSGGLPRGVSPRPFVRCVPAPWHLHDKATSCGCICCLEVLGRIKKLPWGAESLFPPWKEEAACKLPKGCTPGETWPEPGQGLALMEVASAHYSGAGRAKLPWNGEKKVTFTSMCTKKPQSRPPQTSLKPRKKETAKLLDVFAL